MQVLLVARGQAPKENAFNIRGITKSRNIDALESSRSNNKNNFGRDRFSYRDLVPALNKARTPNFICIAM
jgi:hypothetical protein